MSFLNHLHFVFVILCPALIASGTCSKDLAILSEVLKYTGDLLKEGDSVLNIDNIPFSTRDENNNKTGGNCAQTFKGGWWYFSCHFSNLNGLNLNGKYEGLSHGINYYSWKGLNYSLKEVEMKVRPSSYAG